MIDLQSMINNAVEARRTERLKYSPQLTLGEIVLLLEEVENKRLLVTFDIEKYYPVGLDSWRRRGTIGIGGVDKEFGGRALREAFRSQA